MKHGINTYEGETDVTCITIADGKCVETGKQVDDAPIDHLRLSRAIGSIQNEQAEKLKNVLNSTVDRLLRR